MPIQHAETASNSSVRHIKSTAAGQPHTAQQYPTDECRLGWSGPSFSGLFSASSASVTLCNYITVVCVQTHHVSLKIWNIVVCGCIHIAQYWGLAHSVRNAKPAP